MRAVQCSAHEGCSRGGSSTAPLMAVPGRHVTGVPGGPRREQCARTGDGQKGKAQEVGHGHGFDDSAGTSGCVCRAILGGGN